MAHRVRRRWLAWLSALMPAWWCPPLLAVSLPRPPPTAAQQQALHVRAGHAGRVHIAKDLVDCQCGATKSGAGQQALAGAG